MALTSGIRSILSASSDSLPSAVNALSLLARKSSSLEATAAVNFPQRANAYTSGQGRSG